MNTFKKNLHIWITSVSLLAFLTGWGFLSHAAKPGVTQVTANGITQTTISSPYQALQNLFTFQAPTRHRRSSNSVRTSGS